MMSACLQFELLEFVFDSVYVELQYDEISLTFTAGSVSLCCPCQCLHFVHSIIQGFKDSRIQGFKDSKNIYSSTQTCR